jgi:hypothetical protein
MRQSAGRHRKAGLDDANTHAGVTGGAKASRPKLDLLMKLLRDGALAKSPATIGPGRSMLHLVMLGTRLRERSVGMHLIERVIDNATAEGPGPGSECCRCTWNCEARS